MEGEKQGAPHIETKRLAATEQTAAQNEADADADQRLKAFSLQHHCDQVISAQNELGTAAHWRELAAEQGVGAALFERSADKERSPDQRRADFHRALSSADPTVVTLLTIYGSFARDTNDQGASYTRDSDALQAAIALAQCKLGYDCSTSGVLYEDLHCKNVHIRRDCRHADSVERYYELQMKPQRFADLEEYVGQLVHNLRSGTDDWPEAQALEQEALVRDSQGETHEPESVR